MMKCRVGHRRSIYTCIDTHGEEGRYSSSKKMNSNWITNARLYITVHKFNHRRIRKPGWFPLFPASSTDCTDTARGRVASGWARIEQAQLGKLEKNEKIRMDLGWERVARGCSGAKTPPLAARPVRYHFLNTDLKAAPKHNRPATAPTCNNMLCAT